MFGTIFFFSLSVATITTALVSGVAHKDCEYAGVVGGVKLVGTCTVGGNYGAGLCKIDGYEPGGCDFPYRNDAAMTPCYDASKSQYACKYNGAPCYAFTSAEDPAYSVLHCGVA